MLDPQRTKVKAAAKEGPSFAAKVSVEASVVNQQRNRVVSVAKLWDKLTKMTPQKRQEAMLKN